MRLNKRRRLLARWTAVAVVAGVVLGYAAYTGRLRPDPVAMESGAVKGLTSILSREVTTDMVSFRFEDVREAAGIDFQHFPATRRSLLPEDMGSGLAWGDYDNDGDPDLFLVNFYASILDAPPEGASVGRPALYRNEGNGRFTDVTESARLGRRSFGLAAAWGDYDDDGDLDLYVSNYGSNILYRNNGDGTFLDVTQKAGVGDEGFSAGIAWGDFDNDGRIDLYVTNYVQFRYRPEDRARAVRQYGTEIPYTINPTVYLPAGNRLYRNRGDGTFRDVARQAGVANAGGRSLGAAWFDFDNDGWTDLYVANDVSANGVFRNLGDGRFSDIGASSMAADYRGAMGLAVADIDHDGDLDLFVTHWIAQENAFFENMISEGFRSSEGGRRLFFMDSADLWGLGQISLRTVGWATGFGDFDHDGYVDLWVVNGNTLETPADTTRLKPQKMDIFRQLPSRGFFEMAARAAPELAQPIVGRGGAQADYDGDGRLDLAVAVHGGQPLLLRNTSKLSNHWVSLRLRQRGANTRALGAWVTLRAGELTQTAQVGSSGSYLSQDDTDLHFGLGPAQRIDTLTIRWPDGMVEKRDAVDVDQVVTLWHDPDYRRGRLRAATNERRAGR